MNMLKKQKGRNAFFLQKNKGNSLNSQEGQEVRTVFGPGAIKTTQAL